MRKILSIITACLLFELAAFSQTQKIPLENGWEFHESSGSKPELAEWRSATVPGLVHTDLLNHKLIPDPFYRDNEKKCNGFLIQNGNTVGQSLRTRTC